MGVVPGSRTVDSTPTSQGPPSSTASMRPSRSLKTWAAVVGLVCPKRFALGAASGNRQARKSACAAGCRGTRTPTRERPAVTASGIADVRGSNMVSGPGQKLLPSRCTRSCSGSGTEATCDTACTSGTWTMSGSQDGRCFALKIASTAPAEKAFAPRPYTVSVGNATRPPRCRIAAARTMSAGALASRCKVAGTSPLILTTRMP